MATRLVRIASDPRFGELHFKHSKVAKLNAVTFREGFNDLIESFLNHIKNIVLNESRLVADIHNNFTLSESSHSVNLKHLSNPRKHNIILINLFIAIIPRHFHGLAGSDPEQFPQPS